MSKEEYRSDRKGDYKMTNFYIEYNPYLVQCVFKKNNIVLSDGKGKFSAKKDHRLQSILSSSGNWKGLAQEIADSCNDTDVCLHFKGRKIDFDDIQYCLDQYKGNTKFSLSFEETKNDNDIIGEMDKIIEDIKNKNIPQFNDFRNKRNQNIYDAYEDVKSGIFETSVIATMSSGKSTLINSLLHTELLPSENKACTATVARILDNDDMDHYEATCYAADENTVIYPRAELTPELMKEYNKNENVQYIDIEGSIPSIPSDKIRLLLRDTPGPNNSQNENHGKLTNSIIKGQNSVVLYVMNATQIAIKDDEKLLRSIANEMKTDGKQSRDRFIFVVNKCDALDEEKGETVDGLLKDVSEYLAAFGIVDPILIPTSARLALLIRKDKNGEKLTRKEKKALADSIDDFVNIEKLHFEKFATLTPTVRAELDAKITDYHSDEETWDMEALIHTGVPALEATIAEYMEKYAYPMKIKDAIDDIVRILDELNMKAEFDRRIANDSSELQKVRQQIKEAKEKQKKSQIVYDRAKRQISSYNYSLNKDDELFKTEMELQTMTKPFDGKNKVDKGEAENMIADLQKSLEEYQAMAESRLNSEIDKKIFQYSKKLLDDYRSNVNEILSDLQINGFDFHKLSAFKQIRINNVNEIIGKHEEDRMRDETRWKKNPEREGFWGFFKFWKPKEVSYIVQVKDGVDVDVYNVAVDIMNAFKSSIKANIDNMFKQADKQVEEYKKAFIKSIDLLNDEINRIITQIDSDTANSEVIAQRVNENKELNEWLATTYNKIKNIMA